MWLLLKSMVISYDFSFYIPFVDTAISDVSECLAERIQIWGPCVIYNSG